MQIIDSTPAALSANLQMYLRNGDVFFDIETTGLSWRTSHLYLIGALFFDPAADTFTLRQWFLDRPTEEKEMLVSFFTFLSDVKRLVHFNGTTFDLPYLTHKALFYQMEDPLSSIASLDLYQALRPFQSILGLSSMKQKNVEQYLSFPRKDQLNGKQLILVYHDYLQTLDEKKLELLFLHNYEDVLGMGSVLELLALRKGTTLTKEMFLNHLYGGMDEPEVKIIDVFICKLRKKLEKASGGKNYIETVWGAGYRFRS